MNTIILSGCSFYEFDDIEDYKQAVKSYEGAVVGVLYEKDMVSFQDIENEKDYIITIIKEENGEHFVKCVKGIEFKINIPYYEKISHGNINIWELSSLLNAVIE